MAKSSYLILFLLFTISQLTGQETNYGQGYQTILPNNPAFTGCSGSGRMGLSYINFYPGNSYNLHSVFFSYDSYFTSLHGGAGIFISDDYQGGILNDLRGGFSYSYFLQAGREFYINAGLSASFFHRGFNFTGAILPDQINEIGVISQPSSEILNNRSRTVLDVGTGIVLIYKRFFGGLGIAHLTQPDLAGTGSSSDRIKMKYLLNAVYDIDLDARNNLKLRPLIAFELQGNYFVTGMGGVLETNYLSISSLLFFDSERNINMQAGFSLRLERVSLFYNYKFSMKSGHTLMPFSLSHQTGLAISLNFTGKVEKRFKVRTIIMPGL